MEMLQHTLVPIVTYMCAVHTLSYTCAASARLPSLVALFLESICVHPHHTSVPSQGSYHSNFVAGIHYHITMMCFMNSNLFEFYIFSFVTRTENTLALTDSEFEFYRYIRYIVILS